MHFYSCSGSFSYPRCFPPTRAVSNGQLLQLFFAGPSIYDSSKSVKILTMLVIETPPISSAISETVTADPQAEVLQLSSPPKLMDVHDLSCTFLQPSTSSLYYFNTFFMSIHFFPYTITHRSIDDGFQ